MMNSHELARQLLAEPNIPIILSDENDVLHEVTGIGTGMVDDTPDDLDPLSVVLDNPKPCLVLHIERNDGLSHYLTGP